ncbi:hypothetical protein BDF22DRAFT_227969 [Syncephalis plumigaleata]|nr:hypothetical protein BDF22DRAFT_227969 [Syncephalis plumigaleata]
MLITLFYNGSHRSYNTCCHTIILHTANDHTPINERYYKLDSYEKYVAVKLLIITSMNKAVHDVIIRRVHLIDDTVISGINSSSTYCPSNPYTGAAFNNPIPAENAAIYLQCIYLSNEHRNHWQLLLDYLNDSLGNSGKFIGSQYNRGCQ